MECYVKISPRKLAWFIEKLTEIFPQKQKSVLRTCRIRAPNSVRLNSVPKLYVYPLGREAIPVEFLLDCSAARLHMKAHVWREGAGSSYAREQCTLFHKLDPVPVCFFKASAYTIPFKNCSHTLKIKKDKKAKRRSKLFSTNITYLEA